MANTTIAAGDTAQEIDKLRLGGDGHIVVCAGVSFWRSLMRLDLIDELQLSLFPYVAGEGTWLFDGVPKSYRLDLASSSLRQWDRRAAVPAAPVTQRHSPQGGCDALLEVVSAEWLRTRLPLLALVERSRCRSLTPSRPL